MLAWHVIASHKFSCSSCKTNPTSLWPILYFSSTWLRLSAFFLWFSCFMYFVMFGYFIPVFRWYYQRLTKDEVTRKICWEWMWKDRPSDGVLHKVYLLWRKRIALPFRLLHFLIAWSLVLYRYSNRVKEETERLDSLDLEDLEVPFYALFLWSPSPFRANNEFFEHVPISPRWTMMSGITENLKLGFTHCRYWHNEFVVLYPI